MASVTVPALEGARPIHLTTFTVKVDGQPLPATYGIVAIDIVLEADRVPALTMTLQDGDPAARDFEISGGDVFVPGRTLIVEAGYQAEETPLFRGVITGQRIRAARRAGSHLRVEARDPVYRMTLARRSRYYSDLTDSELFERVIAGHPGLSAAVESTAPVHQGVVQYQVSDWDFVVGRAQRLGMLCLVEGGTVRIAKPATSDEPVLKLVYGAGIFDLDVRLDGRTQQGLVRASAWDPAGQELLEAELDDVDSPAPGDLSGPRLAAEAGAPAYDLRHTGAIAQEELDAWAEAAMRRARLARVRGTIRVQGTERVKPGDLVTLGGLGERYNGIALVSGTRHQLGHGDWTTTIQVGLDQEWHGERFAVAAEPAAGLNPPVHGLQIAVVTQLQDDPRGEDRVQVRLPVVDPAAPGTWARLATADAGDGRGTVIRPEIGDEVVVGFLHGDPGEPVILGALHSSARPAPIAAADDNHEKGWVTRNGMRLVFDDEGVSLRAETPDGRRVVLDDGAGVVVLEDGNGNKVTLDSGGITLKSAGDIAVKAAKDVSIEGTKLSLKANSLEAEGSAAAALKSGGTTEVKGSVVRIN
jgi:Rhs element Vgr protein